MKTFSLCLVAAAALMPSTACIHTSRSLAGTYTPAPTVLVPQDSTLKATHDFNAGFIMAFDQNREELLTPLVWRGAGVGSQLGWSLRRPQSNVGVRATLPLSVVWNRYGHAAVVLGAEGAIDFRRNGRAGSRYERLAWGPALRADAREGFYESWDDAHVYWLTAYSLGPGVTWRPSRAVLGRRMAIDVSTPLIAVVSRPPRLWPQKTEPLTHVSYHFTEPQRHLRFATVDQYRALHARVSWALPGRRSAIAYAADVAWSRRSAPIVMAAQRLVLELHSSRW